MTKQDFQLIADTIKGESFNWGGQMTDPQHERLASNFADALAHTNPRFDRARFLKACGVES